MGQDLHKMAALGAGQGGPLHPPWLSASSLWPIGELSKLPSQAGPETLGWPGGNGVSYLVESMVQQDHLRLPCAWAFPYQYIAGVGVTVHEAIDKDHLAIHLAQVA